MGPAEGLAEHSARSVRWEALGAMEPHGLAHAVEWPAMPPKQRQIRIEQRGAMEAIQALEQRSDEELEAETKYKSAALAILGARASERFDAAIARWK